MIQTFKILIFNHLIGVLNDLNLGEIYAIIIKEFLVSYQKTYHKPHV